MSPRRHLLFACPLALELFAGCLAPAARGQMHHVDSPEKVTRAVGVYEWTGELGKPTASRFVPVSLFIDGHFEDAGLYLARPVPFALQNGDLYTVERAGEPEGTLDLDMAERVVSGNALADDNPTGAWYGFGRFTAQAAPKPPTPLHKSAHVGVIQSSSGAASADISADTGDGRPHMSRRTPAADPGDTPSHPAGNNSGSSRPSGHDDGDDTDRPTLARRDPSQDASRRRAVGGKGGTASVTAIGPAPGEDPDRPTLSRKSADTASAKELTGLPADLHQAVAVSDAVFRDPHPFARPWEGPEDRSSTLQAMQALAQPAILAYMKANNLVPSRATVTSPAGSSSQEGTAAGAENGAGAPPKLQRGRPAEYGGGKAPAAAHPVPPHVARGTHTPARTLTLQAPLTLQDEQISGYTLTYGGLPTFAYTARAAAALETPGDAPPARALPIVFVTVVAQRLPSGNLQVALSNVTDSAHLDRGPRLRLIDAVDPDASHRGSLLFELRGNSNRQFAFYRLTSARAENTFTSAAIE